MLAVAVPYLLAQNRSARRRQLQGWHLVAERQGLRFVDSALPGVGQPRLSGRSRSGRRVRIERQEVDRQTAVTRLVVEGDSGITLRAQRSASVLTRSLGTLLQREIAIGDETFDAAVEVRGAPERVRALLDVETRGIVLRMLSGRLPLPGGQTLTFGGHAEIVDGHLQATLSERPYLPSPSELGDVLGALLALADRFASPSDVAQRLADALDSEPLWQVRLYGLQLLATSYPGHAATIAAQRRAIADERAEVALQGAIGLGQEGQTALVTIAAGERVDDATAAHAVHALGDRLPREVALAALHQALRRRRVQTAEACIAVLGKLGGEEAVALLLEVLARERGELAVAAARSLRSCRTREVEDALLRALDRDDPALSLAAVEALGGAGTVRAVPALREVERRAAAGSELRRVARQAVGRIQARLPGATPGQLSLADGEAGRLSLADDDPRGRLSLPAG